MIQSSEAEHSAPTGIVAPSSDRGTQELLVEALAEYHGAVDAGHAPSRNEFLQRYPEIAHELAGYLDGFDFVRQVAPQLTDESSLGATAGLPSSAETSHHIAATLGDFRILREIGRGGMGVVYEAEQLSLGRRVALKVLPFAAMLDRQQLARFKNEARAAATLDHPNIVAIYSVGCERGVHYYAMQLIEGQSLAQLIAAIRQETRNGSVDGSQLSVAKTADFPATDHRQLTTDTQPIAALSTLHALSSTLPAFATRDYFRTIAQLGIQAAEALDHAHKNGILHRDIKPANLLVDDTGKLWITDFGLARLEADAGMTMTGDVLGTLRYMSPEQALGKRAVVEHRSDIYSLGVTLYELITLQPAYKGDDRQELLRQIAFEEPRKLRQFSPRVPQDLETIILKATEKNPADRYATAQEFANDLRRFVDERPIAARRPTLRGIARKWSRRHQAAVFASFVILALMSLGLALASVLIASERNAAVAARNEATEHFQLARDAVDKLMTRVADEELLNAPQMEKLRESLLTDAIEFNQKMLKRDTSNAALQHEVALAQVRMGDILIQLNRREEAATEHSDAIRRLRALTASNPKDSAFKFSLAKALFGAAENLASVEIFSAGTTASEKQTANEHCGEAVRLLEQLNRDVPNRTEYLTALAEAYCEWADPIIEDSFNKAVERLECARATLEPLVHSPDVKFEDRRLYARILRRLGETMPAVGRREEGENAFEDAVRLLRELMRIDPTDGECRELLAGTLWNAANTFPPAKPGEIVAIREECVRLFEGLVRDFPSVPKYGGRGLAMARMHLCFAYRKFEDHDAALEQLLQAKAVLEVLCREFPKYKDGFNLMGRVRQQLLLQYDMDGRIDDLIREADECRRSELAETEKSGDMTDFFTALFELSVGSRLVMHGRNAEGIEWGRQGFQRAWQHLQSLTQEEKEQALHCHGGQAWREGEFNKRITDLLGRLAIDLFNAGDTKLAAEFWQNFSDVKHLSKDPKDLGEYYAFAGRFADAAKHFKAVALADLDDHQAACSAATLLLISGDTEGYEAICQQMLDRFAITQDWLTAWSTSAACLQTSPPFGEPAKLVQLTDVALPTWDKLHNPPYHLRGLAAYRAEDWQDALKWCAKGREATVRDDYHAEGLMIESMALYQLGKPSDSKRAYDEAIALIHKAFPTSTVEQLGVGPEWIDWVWCQQLRREAESLLQIPNAENQLQQPIHPAATEEKTTDN